MKDIKKEIGGGNIVGYMLYTLCWMVYSIKKEIVYAVAWIV